MLIENQRGQAHNGERFAGDARPLQLQARRKECAAGELRTQFIEFLDDGAKRVITVSGMGRSPADRDRCNSCESGYWPAWRPV